MQICLYRCKYSTYIHKNWFLGLLKVKESKIAVKIAEKQHFHVEHGGWEICNEFISSKLLTRIVSSRRSIARIFFIL